MGAGNLLSVQWPGARARILPTLVSLLVLLPALPSPARVFERWGSTSQGSRALENAGGKVAYQSRVTLNGAGGTLTVLSFDQTLRETVGTVAAVFGTRLAAPAGSMSTGTVARDGRRIQLILISPDAYNRTLLFMLNQTEREAAASKVPRDQDPAPGVSPFPGSAPQFSAEDEAGGYRCTVSKAVADPATIHAYFSAQLVAGGWSDPLAGQQATSAAGPALRWFQKGNEVCLVHTMPQSRGEATRITILHKRPGRTTNRRLD